MVAGNTGNLQDYHFLDFVIVKIPPLPSYFFAAVERDLHGLGSPQSGHTVVLLLDRAHRELIPSVSTRISLMRIHNLLPYQRQLKGLLALSQHPLAAALAQLEPAFLSDPHQAVDLLSHLEPFAVSQLGLSGLSEVLLPGFGSLID